MSYLDPRPDWSPRPTPCEVVTQELADVFAILETLSLRLARLEEQASCSDCKIPPGGTSP